MKNVNNFFLILISIFFCSCASKQQFNINEKINSISLYDEVLIANTPRTVPSPVSVGLGIGGPISSNVGIGVGTSFRPELSNNEAFALQRAYALNNFSLEELIKNEFKAQMTNDSLYKDKFVPFGSDFVIHLYVPKYTFETLMFSPKGQIKIFIEIRILNKFGDVVYEDVQVNELYTKEFIYTEGEVISSREALEKATYLAVRQTIARLILQMKKS
ncbi:MAG: hypothetical protein PHG81_12060 [Aliarcobacter sp.]|nr:hypothetical protein [Aliarcobacter sp.]